jgi:hypothetical protein
MTNRPQGHEQFERRPQWVPLRADRAAPPGVDCVTFPVGWPDAESCPSSPVRRRTAVGTLGQTDGAEQQQPELRVTTVRGRLTKLSRYRGEGQ